MAITWKRYAIARTLPKEQISCHEVIALSVLRQSNHRPPPQRMTWLENVYQRSPVWMQNMLLGAYARRLKRQRFGKRFQSTFDAWEESQWWTRESHLEAQSRMLRELVHEAYKSVPFYERLWSDHGVNIAQVQDVSDLQRLPTISKSDVREAGRDMISRGSTVFAEGHTSGTTGSPLTLWYDRSMVIINNVADWRVKRWGGLELGDWCAMFLGRVVVPIKQVQPPFWRANNVQKQLWCSAFHMSEENLQAYVREIRRRNIQFIEGYPSTLFILAGYLLRHGETLPMRAVFTSSETLHAVQREKLRAAFDCPIFDFYGLAERVIFAGECEEHSGKHHFDEYGITELVDDRGRWVPSGQPGTLTGTTLWNRAMPLIRYRTGDISVQDSRPCLCGRGLGRLADVATKAEDIVMTPDGRFISPSVLTHPFKPFHQLRKSQIAQIALDHVIVRLVPTSEFTSEHLEALRAGLQSRLGSAIRIQTEIVDDILPEKSGKFRWVISSVPHPSRLDWNT